MKVLVGTTNPSKVKRFADMLSGYDIEFLTPDDLHINEEPEETGSTPVENAIIKAKFYGQFAELVICNDSGLYFDELPLDDSRQPGLEIRSPFGRRLNDDEMIEYYSGLIASLGGKVLAFYLDGIAVCRNGQIFSFMENDELTRQSAFYMVSEPSDNRHPGWPLDSLSLNRTTMTYFTEKGDNRYDKNEENIMLGEYRKRLTDFLCFSLGLE